MASIKDPFELVRPYINPSEILDSIHFGFEMVCTNHWKVVWTLQSEISLHKVINSSQAVHWHYCAVLIKNYAAEHLRQKLSYNHVIFENKKINKNLNKVLDTYTRFLLLEESAKINGYSHIDVFNSLPLPSLLFLYTLAVELQDPTVDSHTLGFDIQLSKNEKEFHITQTCGYRDKTISSIIHKLVHKVIGYKRNKIAFIEILDDPDPFSTYIVGEMTNHLSFVKFKSRNSDIESVIRSVFTGSGLPLETELVTID